MDSATFESDVRPKCVLSPRRHNGTKDTMEGWTNDKTTFESGAVGILVSQFKADADPAAKVEGHHSILKRCEFGKLGGLDCQIGDPPAQENL